MEFNLTLEGQQVYQTMFIVHGQLFFTTNVKALLNSKFM